MKYISKGLQRAVARGHAGAPARRARPTRAAGCVQNRARAPLEPRRCQAGFRQDSPPWHLSRGAVLAACSFPCPSAAQLALPLPLALSRPGEGWNAGAGLLPGQHRDPEEPRHPGFSPSPALTLKMKVVSITSCFTTHFSLKQTISSHKKTLNIFLLLIIEGQLINLA